MSYTSSSTCVTNCSAGQYNSTNKCQPCATGCTSCNDNTLNNCSSCGTGYYLSYGSTKCVTVCPSGQYPTTNNLCQMCDPSCATCKGASTLCTSCSSVKMFYSSNSSCLSVCPINTYVNSSVPTKITCQNCDISCSICSGPSSSNCSACGNYTDGITLSITIYYKDLKSITCNSSCPNGQYIDLLIPNVCQYCNSTCSVCTSSANLCTACVSGYFMLQKTYTCYGVCPTGYFGDIKVVIVSGVKTYICTACNSLCFTCVNSTSSDCLSCHNITSAGTTTVYFKNPTNNTCIKSCPGGYVGNSLTNTCDQCLYFTFNGSCVTTCPSGYVGVVSNSSTCVLCN
jgi:proprotein convertase subtilisin/kexin type 5